MIYYRIQKKSTLIHQPLYVHVYILSVFSAAPVAGRQLRAALYALTREVSYFTLAPFSFNFPAAAAPNMFATSAASLSDSDSTSFPRPTTLCPGMNMHVVGVDVDRITCTNAANAPSRIVRASFSVFCEIDSPPNSNTKGSFAPLAFSSKRSAPMMNTRLHVFSPVDIACTAAANAASSASRTCSFTTKSERAEPICTSDTLGVGLESCDNHMFCKTSLREFGSYWRVHTNRSLVCRTALDEQNLNNQASFFGVTNC